MWRICQNGYIIVKAILGRTPVPDGDKVHTRLRVRYMRPYKLLCADVFDPENVSRELLRAIRADINDHGGARPLRMLLRFADRFAQIASSVSQQTVDWVESSRWVEQQARMTPADKRTRELLILTCKQQLHDLRNGSFPADIRFELSHRYFTNWYRAEFEDRVPIAKHYNGISQGAIDDRISAMRPYVTAGLALFANQLNRKGETARLRLNRRQAPRKSISLHETDLCSF